MKAVILAGGSGVRLRPISCTIPKPLLPLLHRSLLEHAILFLRRHGIREIGLCFSCPERQLRAALGEGEHLGVRLSYFPEEDALGTAGAAAGCRAFAEEDLLVLSGDCFYELDLRPAFALHERQGAAVTMVLSRQRDPRGCGLVQTDGDGRVIRLLEKPGWDGVTGDRVNTGIYLLSRAALEQLPDGIACDFAREFLPRLLQMGQRVYAAEAPGRFTDAGTPRRYLTAVRAALSEEWRREGRAPHRGIHAASPVPQDAVLSPPVWIDEGVVIGEGAVLGPYTVLHRGSRIGAGAEITGSVVIGATVGAHALLRGSILCPGAAVEAGAELGEGVVIGANARVGRGARVADSVRLWPERICPAGIFLRDGAVAMEAADFAPDGVLVGELTPERLTMLGSAAVMLSGEGARIGVGHGDSPACGMLAAALSCGIRAAGGQAVLTDAAHPAMAAFAAGYGGYPLSFFITESEEGPELRIYDADGLPPEEERLEQLQNLREQGQLRRVAPGMVGGLFRLRGLRDAYCRAAAEAGALHRQHYAVRDSEAAALLCRTLWLMGGRIAPQQAGQITFALTADGGGLMAETESGVTLPPERCFLLAAWTILQSRGEVALPFDRAAVLDDCAGRVLRLGRDGDAARDLWAMLPPLRDGLFQAATLAAHLAARGMTLDALDAAAPRSVRLRRELPLEADRAGFMQAAGQVFPGAEAGQGLRIALPAGMAVIAPMAAGQTLALTVECGSMEAAEELSGGLLEQLSRLDRDIKRRKFPNPSPNNWQNP